MISSFSLGIGESVSAGTAAAGIYPDEYMRIEATVTETDLQYFNVGDPVKIELIYLEGGEYAMEGTVEKISRTARPPVKNPAKLPSLSTSSPRKPRNCFMA